MAKKENDLKIQGNVHELLSNFSKDTFIYDFIKAYGIPQATITRLKQGSYNVSKNKEELLWKNKVFFKPVFKEDLHFTIDAIKKDQRLLKHKPRFIIVTDYKTLLSIDTKTSENLDIPLKELEKNCEFFFPWIGKEKIKQRHESLADIKAAEKMAKLYDAIKKDNPSLDQKKIHALNVFFSRLLFCFFAEDTGIFEENLFTNSIASHTDDDGKDLSFYLIKLFESLDSDKKSSYPKFLQKFPYVNGSLFAEKFPIPKFSRYSRKLLLECGELNWSSINPDIFGSMIQAVVDSKQRGSMGLHYTSTTNIMKVIEPLFLNNFYEEYNRSFSNPKKLQKLLSSLNNIQIFDPACGSGNFLIIAYKELRKLEIKVLTRLRDMSPQLYFRFPVSRIFLTQFYGIELDDFTHEIAILSLWLAEHQMNVEFQDKFGQTRPSIPLKKGGNIICGNAARLDWEEICPKRNNCEIYILGNPPYLGARNQSIDQKKDVEISLNEIVERNNLDYVSCWLYKAVKYISGTSAKVAFVTTNSITQGMQVPILWKKIFEMSVEIGFAYTSFKWTNSAKKNAGVSCVIISLRKICKDTKYLFEGGIKKNVKNINGYLSNYKNIFIEKRRKPLSCLPEITFGSMANDNGYLLLSVEERLKLINEYPISKKFIRKIIGGDEFLYCLEKFCLWINDNNLEEALSIPLIKERIQKVREIRKSSKRSATQKLSKIPHRFGEIRHQEKDYTLMPRTTSENRDYIPIGFFSSKTIAKDSSQIIYDAEPFIFGILSSRMHNLWIKAVAGRLEMRIIYSAEICYNNFPIVDLTKSQKEIINTHVFNIVAEREKHPEKTIAELYDPIKMPKGLRDAHQNLDIAIDRCYRSKPFVNDEERLEYLFNLYEEMIQKEAKEKKGA